MANIKDKIAQIRQAIFGKEVRESIASGIEAINSEVETTTAKQAQLETTFEQLIINAGNSNAEIVAARVKADGTTYPTLGDRLNTIDETIQTEMDATNQIVAEALNKANNPLNQIPDNSIPSSKLRQSEDVNKIHMQHLGSDVIAAITGQSPAGTIPANGSVTTEKVADGAVTESKLANSVKWGMVYSTRPVEVDFTNKKLRFYGGNDSLNPLGVIFCGTRIPLTTSSEVPYIEVDLTLSGGSVLGYLLFDRNTNTFSVCNIHELPSKLNSHILLGVFHLTNKYIRLFGEYVFAQDKTYFVYIADNKGMYLTSASSSIWFKPYDGIRIIGNNINITITYEELKQQINNPEKFSTSPSSCSTDHCQENE